MRVRIHAKGLDKTFRFCDVRNGVSTRCRFEKKLPRDYEKLRDQHSHE